MPLIKKIRQEIDNQMNSKRIQGMIAAAIDYFNEYFFQNVIVVIQELFGPIMHGYVNIVCPRQVSESTLERSQISPRRTILIYF